MRRLIMWNLQTLDGCFNGAKPWQLDFHETAWGPELEQLCLAQGKDIGTLLFGRATYEGMAAYWTAATGPVADMMTSLSKVVFSSTLPAATWRNTRLVRGDAAAAVAELKKESGKNIYVFGSGKLCDGLARAGLFDEYRICLAPVVLGEGAPLWKPGFAQRLRLLEARPLATGGVVLRYAPAPAVRAS